VLLLGWCVWLLASWFIAGWLEGPAAIPRLRTTQLLAWGGVMLVWPAWRLSTPAGRAPNIGVVCDMFSLWVGYQVLAARMLMDFPRSWRGPVIDLAFSVWLLPVGLLVLIGRRSGSLGRLVCMALCAAIVVGGTLAGWTMGDGAWGLAVSPARAIWVLSADGLAATRSLALALFAIGGFWLVCWIAAGVAVARGGAER